MTDKEKVLIESWAGAMASYDQILLQIESAEKQLQQIREFIFLKMADDQFIMAQKYQEAGGDLNNLIAALRKDSSEYGNDR